MSESIETMTVKKRGRLKRVWRVSWDDRWGVYQLRKFEGRNAEAESTVLFARKATDPQCSKARLECNGAWVAGHRGVYVRREAGPVARQAELALEGGE